MNPLRKVLDFYNLEIQQEDKHRVVYLPGPFTRRVTTGYIILALAIVVGLFLNERQASDQQQLTKKLAVLADQNRQANCRQRKQYETNAATTQDFIEKGGHIPGVDTKILLRSIRVNRENADALRGIKCEYKLSIPFAQRGTSQ